jgi:heme o synthase
MSLQQDVACSAQKAIWRDYLEVCKPRVVALMLITSLVGMCLASPGMVPLRVLIFGNLGIALVAFAAAAVNHLADRNLDRFMKRTERRPAAQGRLSVWQIAGFAFVLCVSGMTLLFIFINSLTAILTFSSLVVYAFIYTFYLKHATPQNIVIGGVAGAAPPLLGWVAVTGHVDMQGVLLLLIIFVWTPPHFWALAIDRVEDYAKAKVPMLPNTHGIEYTKRHVLCYTILLFAVTLMPCVIGMSGVIYGVAALLLNARFLQWAIRLKRSDDPKIPMAMFKYSIVYLMLLFVALVVDHYLMVFLHLHPISI